MSFFPAAVKTGSPFTEEYSTFNGLEKTAKNGNGGLIQSVSNILHSQFGVVGQHPLNCSAYLSTPYQPQWTVGDVYLGGFHYNNWQASERTASHSVIEPLTSPNLAFSDNSAILKYRNLSPRTESNSFSLSTSLEAAAVLASFAGNQKHRVPKLWRRFKNFFLLILALTCFLHCLSFLWAAKELLAFFMKLWFPRNRKFLLHRIYDMCTVFLSIISENSLPDEGIPY